MEVRSALTRLQAMGLVERSQAGWRLAEAARSCIHGPRALPRP